MKNNGHVSLNFSHGEDANVRPISTMQTAKPGMNQATKPEVKKKTQKKEIPPQINDVETELKEKGKCLYTIEDKIRKKDKKKVFTKSGKVARCYNPYRVGVLRVKKNLDGDYKLQFTIKDAADATKFTGIGITEKEYHSFLSTASINKRLDLFLKYRRDLIIKKIKNTVRLVVRITEDEDAMLQKCSKECGIKVSELVRTRIHNTQPRLPLSEDNRIILKKAAILSDNLKHHGTALRNYLKTTGNTGVERLDLICKSKVGMEFSEFLLDIAFQLSKLINK